jgi:RNA polymerase sigma-70 factor (ECF subfamily)
VNNSEKYKNESVLIEELANGKEAAYEHLFDSYYEALCLYARKMVNDLDTAEDLVHNTICKLWTKRESLGLSISVKSYLYRSVYNSCLNHIKHKHTENKYVQEKYHQYLEQELYLSPQREVEIMNSELGKQIHSAIESLPEKCREVFKLSRLSGLKNREIAEELDVSINTVQTQLSIALKKLRQQLGDQRFLFFLLWTKRGSN